MSIINRFFPTYIQNSNIITQDSGYSENVSLKNGGNAELRGNVYLTNGGRLMINKNKDGSTLYYLDVSGNGHISGYILCDLTSFTGNQLVNRTFTDATYQTISNMGNYALLNGTNNNFVGSTSNITITNYNFHQQQHQTIHLYSQMLLVQTQ